MKQGDMAGREQTLTLMGFYFVPRNTKSNNSPSTTNCSAPPYKC